MLKPLVPIAILAGIVALAAVACGGDDDEAAAPPPAAAAAPGAAAAPAAEAEETGPVKSGVTGTDETGAILYSLYMLGGGGITGGKSALHGSTPFSWEVTDITFNVGDTVTFTLIPTADAKWSHTFSIKEHGSLTHVKFAKSATATFTFDKPGEYRYWCDIHLQEGMFGYITVE